MDVVMPTGELDSWMIRTEILEQDRQMELWLDGVEDKYGNLRSDIHYLLLFVIGIKGTVLGGMDCMQFRFETKLSTICYLDCG